MLTNCVVLLLLLREYEDFKANCLTPKSHLFEAELAIVVCGAVMRFLCRPPKNVSV
jgi:hypothetical protein